MRHTQAQQLLYEYLNGELAGEGLGAVRERLESHLASCESCRTELEELRSIVRVFTRESFDASKERTPEYWNSFAVNVERRIAAETGAPLKRRPLFSFSDILDHIFFTPRPYVTAFAGALAIVVCMLLVWRWYDQRTAVPTGGGSEMAASRFAPEDSTTRLFRQYVSRSKMLLVGVSNMKPVTGASYDLSVERGKSRELIYQARYLKNQGLDPRSQRLIEDLEKILIELANMKQEGNAPNVEILRGGMHQENILFKIRMEEQTLNVQPDSVASF